MDSKCILIVEDEYLIGLNIKSILTSSGFKVVGPALNEAEALKYIVNYNFDAAVLDVNLGGFFSEKIALRLKELKVPFLLLTGYDRANLPDSLQEAKLMEKPFDEKLLVDTLKELTGGPLSHAVDK